jgi:hypothetical protein
MYNKIDGKALQQQEEEKVGIPPDKKENITHGADLPVRLPQSSKGILSPHNLLLKILFFCAAGAFYRITKGYLL